jgi:glycosyltransferase involved in cell wall biosynthesis
MDATIYTSIVEQYKRPPAKLDLIREDIEDGVLVLRSKNNATAIHRKILFINDYGMARAWRLWKDGVYPSNHLWGCVELAIKGYEVYLPEPANGTGLAKRLKNDWFPVLSAARRLNREDIIYCGHNVLLWTPFLKSLGILRCKIVGLLYAREPLPYGNTYDGIIAHTPVSEKNAARMYTRPLCEHISWGMDLDFFRPFPYEPKWILSCGKTFRDFKVLAVALKGMNLPIKIIHPDPASIKGLLPSIDVESARSIGEGIYAALAEYYYRFSIATLLTILPDPTNRHSIGLTNILESMACGRPIITTRTSAMTSEIDVEKEGVGFFVDVCDGLSLRNALLDLQHNPKEAERMGLKGRQLCEDFFNIDRFANDLHNFFERI